VVKVPFHEVCLSTGVFCQICKEKLSKTYTNTDVEISKVLLDLLGKRKEFDSLEYIRTIEGKNLLMVVFNDPKGVLAKYEVSDFITFKIEAMKKKKTLIVLKGEPVRAIVERIIKPARVIFIRELWLPDGSRMSEIRVKGNLELSKEEIEEVLSKFFDKKVEISVE